MLIAALLELKSRLMLPREEEDDLLDLEPEQAAEELLARMLEYRRYSGAAGFLRERLEAESGFRYRSAPLPPELRKVSLDDRRGGLRPRAAGAGDRRPAEDAAAARHVAHGAAARDRRAAAVAPARAAASGRGRFMFDEAVKGADRVTEAVTLFALLEMYKAGEARWQQAEPFAPITVEVTAS